MQGHEEDHRTDLKLHIVNKVGSERCTRYFYYLGRFLSQKVTKSEFDKSCHRLLGRENLPLHNKLIHSILRNASLAKSPPPNHNRNDHVWSAKVALRDRPSPLVPNGKVESLLLHCRDGKSGNRNMEKGGLCTVVAAPLGGARRAVPVSNRSDFISCYGSGGLSDAEMLRKRMESIAVARGLGGVSSECSSMLNRMLEVYLKKLIKSCVDLSGARSTDGNQRNGLQIQTSNQPSDTTTQVSLLDFRAAMELNPSQLGEDWPLLWERLLMRSFEDRECCRLGDRLLVTWPILESFKLCVTGRPRRFHCCSQALDEINTMTNEEEEDGYLEEEEVSAVVLQIGHQLFIRNHSCTHFKWYACSQCSLPTSSPILHNLVAEDFIKDRPGKCCIWHLPCGHLKGDSGPFAYHRSSSQYADERGKVVAAPARILTLSTSTVVAAPLGGARRAVPVSNRSDFISCYGSGGLSDAEMLRKRMESIAVARGLGGVSSECSSMLNSMLDVYLKKLIKSCVDLSGARSTDGNQRNGLQIQTSNQPSDTRQEQHLVSLLDFRAAMELNPSQLGEHWPLLRERLLMRSFEEREGV
ncbi:hypothetical protein F2Q68_00037684 [Brassica cretica]|uniref:Uncharacterized protein n=1 Tax=Brassica cretica TaxID=69181 RepID=A0A8S9H3I8_BRACR|nr:hypothetical protein F2Q68_00037684 [Brassica cretica]